MQAPAAFSAAFRALLAEIVRRAPRVRGAPERDVRARRRVRAQSGTFAGHRAYSEGDDLRYVDWNVYARTGDVFLKVLEEDDRRAVTIVLDRSASMAMGEPARWLGAQRLAAILGALTLVHLDALRLVLGEGKVVSLQGAAALPRLLEYLDVEMVADQDPVALLRAPLEAGWMGKLLWISDFAEPDAAAAGLRLLRVHGRPCSGWLPAIADDRLPRVGGWVTLRDPESGREEAMQVDAPLRRAMEDELRLLARHQDAVFAAMGYPLVRFPLPPEGDFRLSSWLEGAWSFCI